MAAAGGDESRPCCGERPGLRRAVAPRRVRITRIADMGEATFFPRFEARLKDGLRLVQVREKNISAKRSKRSRARARAGRAPRRESPF